MRRETETYKAARWYSSPVRPKPAPKTVSVVCTVCGLDWKAHKTKTLEECVRLLKAELESGRRPRGLITKLTFNTGSGGMAVAR